MKLIDLERRLARLERTRAARHPDSTPRATVLRLGLEEPSAPHLAALTERGEHRRGWPVLAIRADWPAVRNTGGTAPCASPT